MMFQPLDRKMEPLEPPHDVEEVVALLLGDLSLREKVIMANLTKIELLDVYSVLAKAIKKEFGLMGGNRQLMASCMRLSRTTGYVGEDPGMLIIREVWKRVKQTHMLRVVK